MGLNPSLVFCLRSRRRKKATIRQTTIAPMQPPIIPMTDPVETPPVLAGAVEVLEEVEERVDEGMVGEVRIARVVVDFGNGRLSRE